jgi:hypothetical protein
MAITEDDRNDLYNTVRDKLSPRAAATMMELLPPVGWADVATKRDLDHLREVLDRRFDAIDQRFADLPAIYATKGDLQSMTRWLIGIQVTLTAMLGGVLGSVIVVATR